MTEGNRDLKWIPIRAATHSGDRPLIDEAPFPPRDTGDVTDLASSVHLHGILSPLLLRVAGGRLQIVCGFRRYLAARAAGLSSVPALVAEMGDAEAIRCYLSENLLRRPPPAGAQEYALDLLKGMRDASPVAEEEDHTSHAAALSSGAPRIPLAGDASVSSRVLASTQRTSSRLPGALDSPAGPALLLTLRGFLEEVRRTRTLDVRAIDPIVDALLEGLPPRDVASRTHPPAEDPIEIIASHSLFVAALCGRAGGTLGWEGAEFRNFVLGGLLHDVGMLFVPAGCLLEPRALSPAERARVQSHARIGYALITASGSWPSEVAVAARDHHERWDGSGYPGGKSGTQVDFPVRLLGLLDTYAALTAARPHRDALPARIARERLLTATGLGLFDPSLHAILTEGLEDDLPREALRIPLEATSLH